MSAAHETPVAATETTAQASGVETTAPAPTSTVESTVEPTTEAAPVEAEPAADASVDPPSALIDPAREDAVKIEAVPITSGNLGFKTGPLKLFKFSQRYFWLGDEAPLEESTIAHFHKGNHENKHHTAAHASQTGKGLLLYAKRAEDKSQPEGIFNLAEVTDVAKDGSTEFFFKIHDKKQSFQATKTAERDGWLVAINTAVNEAVTSKDSLRETDAYKDSYKKYLGAGGLAVATGGTAAAAAAKDSKTEDKAQEGAAVPATEGATTKKEGSRSRSRGPLGLFKQTKEKAAASYDNAKEKAEIKKEEKKEEKAETKKEEEVAAVGTGTAAATTAEPEAKTPTQKKRQSSIFGLFKKNEDKSAAPVKETEPVAAEAPKIDMPVETSAPLTETVPTETTETAATTTAPAVDATPAVTDTTPAAPTSAVAGKKERSPSPKGKGFGGLFSRSDKKSTKTEEVAPVAATTADSSTPAETAKTDAAPVADSTVPATETAATEAAPVETTTPAAETKPAATPKSQDKRRSSLQAFLGFGKNKDTTASKEPEVSADGKENFADLPKKEKLSMFRSSSKKVKDTPAATTDAPPVPAKDAEPVAESATSTEIAPIVETTDGEATIAERPAGTSVPTVGQPVAT